MEPGENIWLSISRAIPQAEIPHFREAVLNSYMGRIQQTDIDIIFEIYNTYLSINEKQDKNCPGCVQKVIGKSRQIIAAIDAIQQ